MTPVNPKSSVKEPCIGPWCKQDSSCSFCCFAESAIAPASGLRADMRTEPQKDRGRAWLVLASASISYFLYTLILLPAPILQVEIVRDYEMGSGPVSVVTSISYGIAFLIAPLTGVVVKLLSVRVTVFLGVTLIAVGNLCGSLCRSLYAMLFFYGVMTGIGLGVATLPMIVVVNFYFEKRRVLAVGILMCAPGIGYLVLPYFVRYVIDTNGWRYGMALFGTLTLHVMVCAAILAPTPSERATMVPLSSFIKSCKRHIYCERKKKQRKKREGEEEMDKTDEKEDRRGEYDIDIGEESQRHLLASVDDGQNRQCREECYSENTTHEAQETARPPQEDFEVRKKVIPSECSTDGQLLHAENDENAEAALCFQDHSLSECNIHASHSSIDELTLADPSPRPRRANTNGRLRKDSGSKSLVSDNGWTSAVVLGSSVLLPATSEDESYRSGKMDHAPGIKAMLKSVCRQKCVWILGVNYMLFTCGSGVHDIHIPAFALSKGVTTHQVPYLYTSFGVAMVGGRLLGGLLYNRFKPPLVIVLLTLQLINGVMLNLAPFYARTLLGCIILEAAIGVTYGQAFMLLSPVVSVMLGMDDLPIAFGIIYMFVGVSCIVSPVAAGFIYDATQTYDIPFRLAGSVVIIGSLLLLPIIFSRKDERREHGRDAGDSQTKSESSSQILIVDMTSAENSHV